MNRLLKLTAIGSILASALCTFYLVMTVRNAQSPGVTETNNGSQYKRPC